MRFAIIALTLLGGSVATRAIAEDHAQLLRGQSYAERNCSACHAVGTGPQASPRPDAANFVTIANTAGMTAYAVSVWLQTPHRQMPNLVIDAQDRDDLVAYITSLKTR